MRMDESLPLMTPQEVADLLKISVRSVYRIRADLGGFYLPHLRVLRFRPEVVNACMERDGGAAGGIGFSTAGRSIRAAASKPNPRPKLPKQSIAKVSSSPRPRPLPARILKVRLTNIWISVSGAMSTKPIRKKPIAINVFRPR